MTRTLSIRKNILQILERAEPYALPENQLRLELDGSIRPTAATAEFDEAMLFINTRGFAKTVPDSLDEENVKWTITESGKALLRQ